MELTADDTLVVVARGSSKKYHEPQGDLDDEPLPGCKAAASKGFRWSTQVAIEPIYSPCERCFD